MRTIRVGPQQCARILDDFTSLSGGLVRHFGWFNDEPAIFLERPRFTSALACIPLSRAHFFMTPDSLGTLFTGNRPLNPALCARAVAETMDLLDIDPNDAFAVTQIIDAVQASIDHLVSMPPWSCTAEGLGGEKVGEAEVYLNGDCIFDGEAML